MELEENLAAVAELFTDPTQLTSATITFRGGTATLPGTGRGEGRNPSVPALPDCCAVSQTASTGSCAGRLSMKELTENTARPGPGGP